MTKTTITIESGVKYLSESKNLKELPKNVLFLKGRVGGGGTHLALTSNEPYVICVPFQSLVENKVFQKNENGTKKYKNCLAVYAKTNRTKSAIREFVATTPNPTIVTTYDSLDFVTNALRQPLAFHLLIDEYHLLFNQYSFRKKAVRQVLNNYLKYKSFCFMTATNLEDEFILKELRGIDIVEAVWEDIMKVNIKSVRCISRIDEPGEWNNYQPAPPIKNVIENTVIDIINSFLEGKIEGNAYFFVNSVKFMGDILDAFGGKLNNSNCRTIYSQSNNTELSTIRSTTLSEPKKINFLSSTTFEGSDIYDKDGRIYIVSDASKSHTLVDISTSFQQIAGRIRDSKYISDITHIYTNTRYTGITYEAFLEASNRNIELAHKKVSIYNENPFMIEDADKDKLNTGYITVEEDGTVMFDENLVSIDKQNYKIANHIYKVNVNKSHLSNLEEAYINAGNNVVSTPYIVTRQQYIPSTNKLDCFQNTVIELEKIASENEDVAWGFQAIEVKEFIEEAYTKYPFLQKAIKEFGFNGIKEMNYNITTVKRQLISHTNISEDNKVYQLLRSYSKIFVGATVPNLELKKMFSAIYSQLNITKTPKGSDINKYYSTKTDTLRGLDGKSIKAITLIAPKLIFN